MCLSLSVQVESSKGDPEKESGQESEPPALTVSWCGGVCLCSLVQLPLTAFLFVE